MEPEETTLAPGREVLASETLDELEALEKRCFSCPWSRASFESALRFRKLFFLPALREEGKLIGYAVLFCLYEDAELQNLAVAPEARRRGLGRKLLKACIDEAARRGAQILRLEVRKSNLPARALYESEGFRQTGERKNYYRFPAEDALLYAKPLGREETENQTDEARKTRG